MDIVLERGISQCFPENEFIQRIVRRELQKPQNFEKQSEVDTLSFMAIKSIMHKELMTDELDVYSQFIYKLIFKEPIDDIEDFCEDGPIGKLLTSQSDQHPDDSDGITIRKAHYLRLRSEGPIMLALMSQKMPRPYPGEIRIIMTRKTLQICIRRLPFMAEIPHRDGLEYDTYWAERFTKMVMSKFSYEVVIEMNGEELPADQFNKEYMFNFLNRSILEKLPRVIPPEGWEEHMKTKGAVYMILTHGFDLTNYIIIFCSMSSYADYDRRYYWGYIREE